MYSLIFLQLVIFCIYLTDQIAAQTAILEGDGIKHFQPVIPAKDNSNVDAEQIIYPILRPMMRVFDMMQQNAKALEYADKVEKERKEDFIHSPKSFFDLFKPTQPTTTTTPKPMIERLLEPFLEPLTKELSKLNKASKVKTNMDDERLQRATDDVYDHLPETAFSNDNVRRTQPRYVAEEDQTTRNNIESPLTTLLESLGQNAFRREEVQVGRDRTVNVLGMPVGRRDGLALSPFKGLSYGNQDMYGPIAINDKYNVNWGFLNKIGNLVSNASQKFINLPKQ